MMTNVGQNSPAALGPLVFLPTLFGPSNRLRSNRGNQPHKPRGEEDYNLALGGRRANSVRDAMRELGVASGRFQLTSRGDLDAKGTDEATWAEDRRVDVKLASR